MTKAQMKQLTLIAGVLAALAPEAATAQDLTGSRGSEDGVHLLVGGLSAYDPLRAADASDPENAAARSSASAPARSAPRWPESAAARAAAASDPRNVAAYGETVERERLHEADATTPGARAATASDPENVAARSEG